MKDIFLKNRPSMGGYRTTSYSAPVSQIPSAEEERRIFEEYATITNEEERKKRCGEIALMYTVNIIGLMTSFYRGLARKKGRISFGNSRSIAQWARNDCYQVGFLALMDAVDQFDVTKGTRFTTYSPYHVYYRMLDWYKWYAKPWHTGRGVWNSDDAVNLERRERTAEHRELTELGELLPYEQEWYEESEYEWLEKELAEGIGPSFAYLLVAYYLDGQTLAQIGEKLRVTRERVRQMLEMAKSAASKLPALRDRFGLLQHNQASKETYKDLPSLVDLPGRLRHHLATIKKPLWKERNPTVWRPTSRHKASAQRLEENNKAVVAALEAAEQDRQHARMLHLTKEVRMKDTGNGSPLNWRRSRIEGDGHQSAKEVWEYQYDTADNKVDFTLEGQDGTDSNCVYELYVQSYGERNPIKLLLFGTTFPGTTVEKSMANALTVTSVVVKDYLRGHCLDNLSKQMTMQATRIGIDAQDLCKRVAANADGLEEGLDQLNQRLQDLVRRLSDLRQFI